MQRYVMKRKQDGLFFVSRRPNTGLGDLMTDDPNEAAVYNHPKPLGFSSERELWEAVEVEVSVVLKPSEQGPQSNLERYGHLADHGG